MDQPEGIEGESEFPNSAKSKNLGIIPELHQRIHFDGFANHGSSFDTNTSILYMIWQYLGGREILIMLGYNFPSGTLRISNEASFLNVFVTPLPAKA